MQIFLLVLKQMTVMFIFMLVGFILQKKHIVPLDAQKVFSRAVAFVFMPAMIFRNLVKNATVDSLRENYSLFLYGLLLLAVAIGLSYPVTKFMFRKDAPTEENAYKRNLYKYSFAIANYGYIGNVLVREVWGEEMLFKFLIFTLPLCVTVHTWGLYNMIPKKSGEGTAKLLKRLINPLIIAVFAGLAFGMLGVGQYLPSLLEDILGQAANCVGPVCMMISGMAVGAHKLKEVFSDKKIYLITFMRLILMPALLTGLLMLLRAPEDALSLALVAYATPIGLNVIVFPATYGSDTRPGAGMVLISNVLAVVTLPLMYLLFVEIL